MAQARSNDRAILLVQWRRPRDEAPRGPRAHWRALRATRHARPPASAAQAGDGVRFGLLLTDAGGRPRSKPCRFVPYRRPVLPTRAPVPAASQTSDEQLALFRR